MDILYWIVGFVVVAIVFGLASSSDRAQTEHEVSPWDTRDADNQLRFVSKGPFKKKRLMNRSEYGAFKVIENWMATSGASGYRLFAQVNLGEFLRTPNTYAFKSINSKRTDFLIIDARGHALAAIEYQGTGHAQGNAAKRDAVKATALTKAGIHYIEIFPDDSCAQIEEKLSKALL